MKTLSDGELKAAHDEYIRREREKKRQELANRPINQTTAQWWADYNRAKPNRRKTMGYEESSKLGRIGEQYVLNALKTHYCNVKLVPDNYEDQMKFSDILVMKMPELGIHKHTRVEVKTELDSPMGSFFMEYISNTEKNIPGWLHTSPADVLYYLFVEHNCCYKFTFWKDAKRYILENKDSFQTREQVKTAQHNKSHGYMVPWALMMDNHFCVKFDLDQHLLNQARMFVNNTSREVGS